MSTISSVEKLLKDNGKSVTVQRKAILEVFEHHDALSMKELVETLAEFNIDRASVYRGVDLFVSLGIINRIQIGWKYKLELSEQFSDHHHHITCKKCHKIEILEDDAVIEEQINVLAKKADYELTRHTVDLIGICPNCCNN